MQNTTHTLIKDLIFPEGLRWHENRLFFSDMNDGKVICSDADGRAKTVVKMPGPCSGLGWRPDGTLLVVSMLDRRLMSWDGEHLTLVSDLFDLATYHCNDMVVDNIGRAYIGNFGFDLSGGDIPREAEVIVVMPDGSARIAADKMKFPNGMVITPDHKTLVVAETYGACLTAFDILEDGMLANRRIWADLTGAVPDGISLDAEGGIWLASPISAEVIRVLEGGRVTHRIGVSTQAYACMLGGEDRKTLFIATSGRTPRSGRIETVQVDVPGAGLP